MMEREEFQQKFGIVGRSPEMLEIVDVVRQVAPTEITVLITGESGVGKEVIARALHGASHRSAKPLVNVNCGAIPEGLIESELFGHEKGSFTSAIEMRKGYFESAAGGAIFLDEIGEMPFGTQVKLLRVLESGEYARIGSSTPKKSDARVIAATSKTLEYEVQQKRFRPDLYFRLRSVNIHVPPLRNRKEDIPLLAEYFVQGFSKKNSVPFAGFSQDALDAFVSYNWPGNVRELRNVIESLLVLESGRRITAESVRKHVKEQTMVISDRNLPVVTNKTVEQAERELIYRALVDLKSNIIELREMIQQKSEAAVAESAHGPSNGNGAISIDEMERRMIVEALARHNGNRRSAAKDLHISERTLYRKIRDFGLS